MNPRPTLATAGRVLAQLRRDRRTIALVVVLPCVLLWLFKEVFAADHGVFQQLAPALLAVFPLTRIEPHSMLTSLISVTPLSTRS